MSLTARDLNAALWAAADEMRLVMSADVYKDYLLGLVFYKALSDKILVEAYELLNDEKPENLEVAQKAYEEAGADSEVWCDLQAELEDRYGCAIRPRMTFSAFYQQINERTFMLDDLSQAFPLDVILPFATPSTFHGVAKHAIFAGVQRQRRSAPAEQGAQHL